MFTEKEKWGKYYKVVLEEEEEEEKKKKQDFRELLVNELLSTHPREVKAPSENYHSLWPAMV